MLALQNSVSADVQRARRPQQAVAAAGAGSRGGQLLALDRGAEIFAQGAPARRIYRVVSGAVRTVALMCDGRRQIGAFYFPGDWFGIEASPAHQYAAEALSEVRLESHDRSAIMSLGVHPELGAELMAAMVKELSRAHDHMMLLGRKTAEEKVATFLIDLDTRGVRDLPMRRQDIADYLGLTIETVSRMFSHLQQAGVITICNTRRLVILDRQELAGLAA